MRIIVVILLLLINAAALADGAGERSMRDRRAPNAAELIGGLYRFDRIQQDLMESAELNGNEEVRNLAAFRAEDATARDKALKQIQARIGTEPRTETCAAASELLAAPDAAEGPSYVRKFYAVQVAEYKAALALIERYLDAPDNAALRAFAQAQRPVLRSQLKDAERTIADK